MASSFFKRLEEKYGKKNLHGQKYNALVKDILAHNNEKISNAVGRLSNDNYKKQVHRLSKTKRQIVKLPDMTDVLPKRSVYLIKGAEQGDILTDTLRSRLEKDLRETLDKYLKTGKPTAEIQRGKATGRLNPELIKEFQGKITDTFSSYTKRDKKTGVPPQVRNIAVTEIRSTISSVKAEYNKNLQKQNPGSILEKVWRHNRALSKIPRKTHIAMHGKSVLLNEKFRVEREDGSGFDLMDRPHDPNAPAEQVIGCSCEVIYRTIILKEL